MRQFRKLARTKLVNKTIDKALMTQANPRCETYLDTSILHEPREEDVNMPDTIEKFQKVVGDLRYSADCTRIDLNYVTNAPNGACTIQWKNHRLWHEGHTEWNKAPDVHKHTPSLRPRYNADTPAETCAHSRREVKSGRANQPPQTVLV